MNLKIFFIVLGFAFAPMFITANTVTAPSTWGVGSPGSTIVGDQCFIRVYHTNFAFPPEGGQIVQRGNELFFWRNYLPSCSVLPAGAIVIMDKPTTPVPVPTAPPTHTPGTSYRPTPQPGGSPGSTIVGDQCFIRVYHTNFAFPPEGGQIVQRGNELFFWRNYLPGCSGL
jgi:hypothetical protein